MLALPCMAWHPLKLCWPCQGWLPTRGRLDRVPGLPTPPQALSCASNSNLVLPDRWALDGLAARGGDPRRLIRPDGPTRGEVKVRCPWPVAARAGPARVVASHISCGVTALLPTCLPGSVAAPLPTCFPAWGTTHGRRPRVPAPVLGALPAHARGGQPAGGTRLAAWGRGMENHPQWEVASAVQAGGAWQQREGPCLHAVPGLRLGGPLGRARPWRQGLEPGSMAQGAGQAAKVSHGGRPNVRARPWPLV